MDDDAPPTLPAVERVHGKVHPGTLVDAAGHEGQSPSPIGLPTPAAIGRAVSQEPLPAATVIGFLIAIRDPVVALLLGAAAFGALRLHQVAGGVRFGFADGFLRFRSDESWPYGVQEDDDFRWTWTPAERGPADRPRSPGR